MQTLHGNVVDVLLQKLDLGCYVIVNIVLIPGCIQVAGQCIGGLIARLVQNSQVCPGCRMTLVQLYCTDVGLQRVHRLILLLVQHSYRAPCVSIGFRLVNGLSVGHEGIMNLVQLRIAPSQHVPCLAVTGVKVNRLLQVLDGPLLTVHLVSQM